MFYVKVYDEKKDGYYKYWKFTSFEVAVLWTRHNFKLVDETWTNESDYEAHFEGKNRNKALIQITNRI